MNENFINNKKMENKTENYYLIEINKNNILNLNGQLKIVKNEIKELKEYFDKRIESLSKIITKNRVRSSEKNEIIIDKENNNDLIEVNNIFKEMDKRLEKKIKVFEDNIYQLLTKMMEKEKEEKSKKDVEKFNQKLFDIYFDKDPGVSDSDLSELKKLSAVLLINDIKPLQLEELYFKDKVNNRLNNFDENSIKMITMKKFNIVSKIKDIEDFEIKQIETNNIKEFNFYFRKKYGITEKDINDKKLEKFINKNEFDEKEILIEVLKYLKYIK